LEQINFTIYSKVCIFNFSFLSQGSSLQTTAWKYQVGLTTVHFIIKEVCEAIWKALSPLYLKPPNSEEEWYHVAQEFNEKRNFPNCLGSLDGKHINIQAPANSGSMFYNYKKKLLASFS
jgi:hypothetical protein